MVTVRRRLRGMVAAALAFWAAAPLRAQTSAPADSAGRADSMPPGRFYHGLSYGSEATFNPLSEILDEGFDILQLNGHDHHVLRLDYAGSAANVLTSLAHARAAMRRYGPSKLVRNELLPLSTSSSGGAQWVPNYEFHLLGSGMVSARMTEWYEAHGVPLPTAAAVVTMMGAHFLNEVVENGQTRVLNADPVVDLGVFDVAGIALFRVDAVRRLFSNSRVMLTNWPGQPTLAAPGATLENTAQSYMLRVRVPRTRDWSAFYYFGMTSVGGLALDRGPGGTTVSLGAGVNTVDVPVLDASVNQRTAELHFAAALFVDRRQSLLASLVYGGGRDAWATLNVYPGVTRLGDWSPGFWLQLVDRRGGGVRFGLTSPWGLGLGGATR